MELPCFHQFRVHLQTDFATLNVIVTKARPPLNVTLEMQCLEYTRTKHEYLIRAVQAIVLLQTFAFFAEVVIPGWYTLQLLN